MDKGTKKTNEKKIEVNISEEICNPTFDSLTNEKIDRILSESDGEKSTLSFTQLLVHGCFDLIKGTRSLVRGKNLFSDVCRNDEVENKDIKKK